MSTQAHRRIVAVDFDGTLAKTKFPKIISAITENISYCKQLKEDGAILILWTCRKGKDLLDAVNWCGKQGLTFDYVNENTVENIAFYGGVDTRKIYAHEYIDDRALNPDKERMLAHQTECLRRSWLISIVGIIAALTMGAMLIVNTYLIRTKGR